MHLKTGYSLLERVTCLLMVMHQSRLNILLHETLEFILGKRFLFLDFCTFFILISTWNSLFKLFKFTSKFLDIDIVGHGFVSNVPNVLLHLTQ